MKFDHLRRHHFARNGAILAWYDSGGSGSPVVFQHGLGGDARQSAEAFPDDQRFRLITLECRGHGSSAPVGPFTIAGFADDLAALIDATVAGPVVLGGVSMGAAIALRLAVRQPAIARRLVLVRPAWIDAAGPANLQPNAEVGRLLADLPPDVARTAFAASATARDLAGQSPDNLASLMGFFDRPDPASTAQLLQSIAADGPGVSEADLAHLAAPCLICGTEEDAIHPLNLARRLARSIPGARLDVLTPKGRDREAHFAELHAALAAFLEET